MYKIELFNDTKLVYDTGYFKNKEEAINNAYSYINGRGLTTDLDSKEECVKSILKRGYYMIGCGSYSLELKEINT